MSLVDRRALGAVADEGSRTADNLSDEETAGQADELRRGIAAGRGSNRPRVIPYNPDKRWT